jgi:hypothetical protein
MIKGSCNQPEFVNTYRKIYMSHMQHIKYDERRSLVGGELKECDMNAYIWSEFWQNTLLS